MRSSRLHRAEHSRRVAAETAVAPQDVIQRIRRGRARKRGRLGDKVAETVPSGTVRDHRVEGLASVPRVDQRPPQLGECPERLADRSRFVPELRFASPGGFAIRSADDPVVGLHHRVGEEHLPLDGADRENREAAVVRELAEPVGEVALPPPAQPRDPMRRDLVEEAFRRLASAELLPGSNCLSQTNRVTPASAVSSSRCSRSRRSPGGTRSAMRASIRRSASTSASAQSRSMSSWPAGWFGCHGRPRRTCAPGPRSTAPVPLRRGAARRAHAPRRPRRTGIRTDGAARPDARAGSRTAPRSRRARPRRGRAGGR